jgi:porin
MLYPHLGRGVDGFQNTSLLLMPTLLRTTNLSFNGAGVLALENRLIQGGFLVYDTNNSSTTAGFDTLFDSGAVMLGYWRSFTEYGGRPGSHGFIANYSTRTYASTDPLSWTVIPGQGLVPDTTEGSWAVSCLLDQVVWQDCCNPERNVRLFSECSIADGDPNPYRWTANVSLQATGWFCSREADRMGVGYFYNGLSSDFKSLVSALPGFDIQDVKGRNSITTQPSRHGFT